MVNIDRRLLLGSEIDTMPEPTVAAVERALKILACFGEGRTALGLRDLAERTGLYKSTILRLAGTLEASGFLRREADGTFHLGAELWRLGTLYARDFNLAEHIRPVLRDLAAATGESASFYIRDGKQRICLFRQNSAQAARHHLDEGTALPLGTGAAGHLLEAYTEPEGGASADVLKTGFSISVGERDKDTAAIAVPVHAADGRFLGALAVSGLRTRFTEPARNRAIELARSAATLLKSHLTGPDIGR